MQLKKLREGLKEKKRKRKVKRWEIIIQFLNNNRHKIIKVLTTHFFGGIY